jgi:acyl-coenzyme A thioesterase PaaI-like protein
VPLVHHELCFGCGRANILGLLLEVQQTETGSVAGRCFVKQDHQGPDPANAHQGVIAAALVEAMLLACGPRTASRTFEISYVSGAHVGTFLEIEAHVEGRKGELRHASATAHAGRDQVAFARGTFEPWR